jgi:integrase
MKISYGVKNKVATPTFNSFIITFVFIGMEDQFMTPEIIKLYKKCPQNPHKKIEVTHYKFRQRYIDLLTGKRKKVTVTYDKNTARTRKAAAIELHEKVLKKIAEGQATESNITLADLLPEFLDLYKKQVVPRTYILKSSSLKRFILTIGDDVRAKMITPAMLNKYLDDRLYKNELSNGTVKIDKDALALLFKYAKKYGYIKDNPIEEVSVSWKSEVQKKRDQIENEYLTNEEAQKIFDYYYEHHRPQFAKAFKLQFLIGLRFGELAALQVKNVIKTEDKYYLDIVGSLVTLRSPARHYKSDATKTSAGLRRISLSAKAIKIVKEQMKDKNPDDWLFTSDYFRKTKGKYPLITDHLNTSLKKAAKEKKINKHITTHIFRHTHVSNLADAGVPLHVIQARVGHESSDITRKIYMHVTEKAKDDLEMNLKKIDKLLN